LRIICRPLRPSRKLRRADDRNIVKRIQRQQVPLARDDRACAARKRDIEEFVVFGVTASLDLALDVNDA